MTGGPFRIATGGRVDRARPRRFRFDGRTYEGLAGDSLASALIANGVRVIGRSFRFHRPRGVMAAGAEEANAIVQLGVGPAGEADCKATQVPLAEGLEARAVNAWPNARFDLGAVLGLLRPLFTAGFYYKSFMWPRWGLYAPWIRRAAGLGAAPTGPDPDVYAKTFAHCEVLVIGGGAAGLAAARVVAVSGARLMIVDDKPYLGGALTEGRYQIDGREADEWVGEVERELADRGATVLVNTTATAWNDDNFITLHQEGAGAAPARSRLWKVRAARVILATGAFERPLVFPGNDRPGVMLASAARAYAVRFGVAAGRRAVIATNNDSAYETARDLLDAGIEIAAIADARSEPLGAAAEDLRARGVAVLAGHAPVATHGRPALGAVTLAPIDEEGRPTAAGRRVTCDLLAMSGGWNPVVHLFSQSGGVLRYDEADACFKPDRWTQGAEAAGAAAGVFTLAGAMAQGEAAGRSALAALHGDPGVPAAVVPSGLAIRPLWEVRLGDGANALVDFQNDVSAADVRQAAREGYLSVEHLKRYTTLGMALDQGKTSNVNGIGVLAAARGAPIADIGVTTFRPPFNPVTFGAFAGRALGEDFRTLRRLPSHEAQVAAGAVFEDYSGWLRPACYPRSGEAEEAAVRRECLAVRQGAGVFEASPLGKILVAGPDAGQLLDRLYVQKMSGLAPGRCRYGIMLREDGGVLDDGVVMRLAETRFLVGTTSARSELIGAWIEEWLQCEWPALDAVCQPLTSQFATVTLAGPNARGLLAALAPAMDLSDDALAHMAFADGELGGVPCRVARVSFTGERSYEISVAADRGETLWSQVVAAGATPIGVEALMRLRLEKGYLHVGADTEPSTWPQDIGLTLRRADFVGRRGALRDYGGPRRELVGIEARDPAQPIALGGHILAEGSRRSQGWVTSSAFSPTLDKWVALALVEDGARGHGETVRLYDNGEAIAVRIRPVGVYDPSGLRLNA